MQLPCMLNCIQALLSPVGVGIKTLLYRNGNEVENRKLMSQGNPVGEEKRGLPREA